MSTDKQLSRLVRKQARELKQTQDAGLRQALGSYEGRRFLWDLLADGQIFENAFTTNALQTAFNCGGQKQAHNLLARILEVNADAYLQMMRENQEYENQRNAAILELQKEEDD